MVWPAGVRVIPAPAARVVAPEREFRLNTPLLATAILGDATDTPTPVPATTLRDPCRALSDVTPDGVPISAKVIVCPASVTAIPWPPATVRAPVRAFTDPTPASDAAAYIGCPFAK
jgi:hypothetical protein